MLFSRQRTDFADALLPNPDTFLEEAIEWIKHNLTPDDIFNDDTIAKYAKANLEIDRVYPESIVLSYVSGTFDPSDVFETGELEAWAEENGFVKGGEE